MANVSLILPLDRTDAPPGTSFVAAIEALERSGHTVDVVCAGQAAEGPGAGLPAGSYRWIKATDRGRAAAAVAGLERARGEYLLLWDPTWDAEPADLLRVVSALESSEADVVLASRREPAGLVGRALRKFTGTSDPLSGLVGITRAAADEARGTFMAAGSRFTPELLAKVRGRRLDVPGRPRPGRRRARFDLDDVRQLKRLADHRYGNLSRLLQFCAVGASGMVIDLSSYAALQALFARTPLASRTAPVVGPLDLAAAGLIAVAIALCWNFSLNRRLTFSYARKGSIGRQFLTYVLSNAVAVTLNLTLRLTLPRAFSFFDQHRLAAAVVGIVLATGVSFSMSRWIVFRQRKPAAGSAAPHRHDATRPEPSTVS